MTTTHTPAPSPTTLVTSQNSAKASKSGVASDQTLAPPPANRSEVKSRLAAEISSRMEVIPDCPLDKDDVIEPYVTSLKTLDAMRDEVQNLVPALCAANLMFRQDGEYIPQDKQDAWHREMIRATAISIPPPENAADAKVLALDGDELAEWLKASIDLEVEKFVDCFFEALDNLVDRGLAGLAIWTSPTTLEYSYVRQVIERTLTGERVDYSSQSVSQNLIVESKVTTGSGVDTHTLVRHEHHVYDACERSVGHATATIPLAIQRYIDTVPEWLLPLHRIIEGKIGSKSVAQKTYHTEEWTETIAVERRQIFIHGWDPAVAIGDVILIGWDDSDVRAELKRRQAIVDSETATRERNRSRQLSPRWGLVAGLTAFTSLWFFWQPSSQLELWAAYAALLLFILPCVLATSHAERAGTRVFSHSLFALGLVCLLLSVGLLCAFRLRLWSVIAASPILFISGVGMLGAATVGDATESKEGQR